MVNVPNSAEFVYSDWTEFEFYVLSTVLQFFGDMIGQVI